MAKDDGEAVKWWHKAADQGDAEAQHSLARCYIKGEGVVKNNIEAVKWLRKAADQGHAGAQQYLGACYAKGDGVNKDNVEATKWYRKAAEQGEPTAQSALGARYRLGEGAVKNYVEAYKWLNLAASQRRPWRRVEQQGWAARWPRWVFRTSVCKGLRPSWPRARSRRCPAQAMMRGISRLVCRCSRAIRAERWWTSAAT